jgi:hypothetical protein
MAGLPCGTERGGGAAAGRVAQDLPVDQRKMADYACTCCATTLTFCGRTRSWGAAVYWLRFLATLSGEPRLDREHWVCGLERSVSGLPRRCR